MQDFPTTGASPTRLPDGWRIYAIGDIHGRVDLLNDAIRKIDADLAAAPCDTHICVFVGDYIDRGPDSRAVLDVLVNLPRAHPTVCLAGNHELYALRFLKTPYSMTAWLNAGGLETLRSYGIELDTPQNRGRVEAAAEAFRQRLGAHGEFLATLPTTFTLGDYLFVHAGIRPNIALGWQAVEDLVTIRQPFLSHEGSFGKIVVHGHSPVAAVDIRPNRINIDTGAYATSRLSCIALERNDVRIL